MRIFPVRKWLIAFVFASPCFLLLSAFAQQQTINLGPSAIPLTGPRKFSPGDSPWLGTSSSGHFLWADPAFNDSGWAAMDLTPPAHSIDVQFGSASFLPGWTVRGYPHLRGYAWYRLRLHIGQPGQRLWISMPMNTDDAFQVDRTRAISTQSAKEIAVAAQDYGQQDDITVLTVAFVLAEVLHA